MLELKAILNDFASFLNLNVEVNERKRTHIEAIPGGPNRERYEYSIEFEYRGVPTEVCLAALVLEPDHEFYEQILADVALTAIIGKTLDTDEFEERLKLTNQVRLHHKRAPIDFSFFSDDAGRNYTSIRLDRNQVDLTNYHITKLELLLLELYLQTQEASDSGSGYLIQWPRAKRETYHKQIHDVFRLVDRIFEIEGVKYLESSLEPFDWEASRKSSTDEEILLAGFKQASFTGNVVWSKDTYIPRSNVLTELFATCVRELDQNSLSLSNDYKSLWVFDSQIVTPDQVYAAVNTILTFGSSGYFKIPEGANPFLEEQIGNR
jgi:hypothetical protein